MAIERSQVVSDAVDVVSRLIEGKVRRARICGCQPCKNEAQTFLDWLSDPTPTTPQGREAWWK
jgi:hypothetical protein